MEISFCDIREKEVINIYDGKKLGHIIDIIFDKDTGQVQGVVVPGIKKFMRRAEDIFVPMANLKKIGQDVLLVRLAPIEQEKTQSRIDQAQQQEMKTYLRYKRVPPKEN